MGRRRLGVGLAILSLVLAVPACAGDEVAATTPSTFDPDDASVDVDTSELRAAKQAAGIESCPRSERDAAPRDGGVPAIELPCLGGGAPVNLAGLGVPAVLNLWAQYCGPCRTEAPAFQRVHAATEGQLAVIGINWQDPLPAKAIAFADQYNLTYPQLADPDGATRAPLQVQALPLTAFVDADGTLAYVYKGVVDSPTQLADMVSEHLGVEVDL